MSDRTLGENVNRFHTGRLADRQGQVRDDTAAESFSASLKDELTDA